MISNTGMSATLWIVFLGSRKKVCQSSFREIIDTRAFNFLYDRGRLLESSNSDLVAEHPVSTNTRLLDVGFFSSEEILKLTNDTYTFYLFDYLFTPLGL